MQIAFAQRRLPTMRLFRFLLPLIALSFLAAASKPKLMIRFHAEVNPASGSSFAISAPVPGSSNPISLSKVPEITESDVAAIFPFAAEDGSMGCVFKLDTHGRLSLDSLSTESHGALLVGFVNGRAVTAMLIDRRVSDGVITIARGLTPAEIALMTKAYPTIAQQTPNPNGPVKAKAASATDAPVIVVPPPLPGSRSLPRGD